ncbi:DUF1007 family protein [Stappia taiwanensis]|uniref:DUF1007 family protein n=1 Tax=Stappia taiwanensis TaxID=992267 RepID=A0A838XZZ1_9HYPH|nr:DUF1007 family protein [Stappia taiwanensis]MBA4612383.1 DUF1007 family protein [Stappia taiwanensis]GGF04942.1 ABC transporter substrate-binding protein [Stappia taiwanensis]
MRFDFARVIVALLALLVPGTQALAHPHVFVEARAEIVFDEAGRLSAVRHVWRFDEAFTAFAVQGLDADGDGTLSREELQPLAQINVESLAEYDFFTFLYKGEDEVAFGDPVEYWLDFYGGRLTLFYTLPLKQEMITDASSLTLDVFDPTYFVAFEMTPDTPFSMVDAPATCTLTFTPPPKLDEGTAMALSQIPATERELSPDLMQVTETLSNSASVGCK